MLKLDFKENMDSIETLKVIILQSAGEFPLGHWITLETLHVVSPSECVSGGSGAVMPGRHWRYHWKPVSEKSPCHWEKDIVRAFVFVVFNNKTLQIFRESDSDL